MTWKNIIKDKATLVLIVILLGTLLLFQFDIFVYPFGFILTSGLIIARILHLRGTKKNE
tara:strand:- start:1753 stop:1929 length:177 start_codon:yes stop_codon:yes gene_type:complete